MTNLFKSSQSTAFLPMQQAATAPVAAPVLPAIPTATTAPPVAPTIQAPAAAPTTAQINQAQQTVAATIGQRAGRSSTVLTTRQPRGNYSSNPGATAANSIAGGGGSAYSAKTLG